jgi:hypothetical protein
MDDGGRSNAPRPSRGRPLLEDVMQLTHTYRNGLVGNLARAALLILVGCSPGIAQDVPPVVNTVNLSGPRLGVTYLSGGIVRKLEDRQIDVSPVISQFGWQWEKQFFTSADGSLTMVTEWVGLAGGLEQNVFLPSLSWLVGLRTREGAEFGLGPNVTPAGVALVFAGGMTIRAGSVNVPINVAVVPSKMGTRVSVLTGLSLRRESSPSRRGASLPPPRWSPPPQSWPPPPLWPGRIRIAQP